MMQLYPPLHHHSHRSYSDAYVNVVSLLIAQTHRTTAKEDGAIRQTLAPRKSAYVLYQPAASTDGRLTAGRLIATDISLMIEEGRIRSLLFHFYSYKER